MAFEVTPTPNIGSSCLVGPYNCILSFEDSIENLDLSTNLENIAIYGIVRSRLDRRNPTFVCCNCKNSSQNKSLPFSQNVNFCYFSLS